MNTQNFGELFKIIVLISVLSGVSFPQQALTKNLPPAAGFTMVNLDARSPAPVQLAVQACAGLNNQKKGGSTFVHSEPQDLDWLTEFSLKPTNTVEAPEFLKNCIQSYPTCVLYSYKNQQRLLPNILTVGAVLGALPIAEEMGMKCPKISFNAISELKTKTTPLLATEYVYKKFLSKTSGLAMLNPGYDLVPKDFSNPGITRDMPGHLVDYVFAKKLFTIFLVNGCINGNPEKKLFQEIINKAPWPSLLPVYGYNNSWGRAGYVYEAHTRCLESKNMGAIPTETGNLSFYSSRRPPIKENKELQGNPPAPSNYDPKKTYVAFVVGDGDNIQFIMTTRRQWLRQRLEGCKRDKTTCAPLSWSISPHLVHLAPDVLKWYYASSRQTGNDYFILPPSGHLYAYPTSLRPKDQDSFVTETEKEAKILGIKSTVHWDWFETWQRAEKQFLPKYAKLNGPIKGIFPINVPYMLKAFPWWPANKFFRILTGKDGGKTVVFKPRQWRGITSTHSVGGDKEFYLSPQEMAKELGSYPPGTVTWVYMTSDGGLTLENAFMELVKILPPHVQLVNTDTAAELAVQSEKGF